jgi:hypothetical protein
VGVGSPGQSHAPASIRNAKDVAHGLRYIEEAARAADPDYALSRTLQAVRLLGPVVTGAITALQRAGKLPACGTREWARLTGVAENGQVSIAPVLLIGNGDYACEDIVENRIRGQAAPAPQSQAGQVSLAGEIAGWA